jgi:hypothetical protein
MPMYRNMKEVFDELSRRVSLLRGAPQAYHGLAVRLLAKTAVDLKDDIPKNDAYSEHRVYPDEIGVFEEDDGYSIGVPPEALNAAMSAEFGTTKAPVQPLWRAKYRESDKEYLSAAEELANLVARKVEAGEDVDQFLSDGVLEMPDIRGVPGLDELRDLVKSRNLARNATDDILP